MNDLIRVHGQVSEEVQRERGGEVAGERRKKVPNETLWEKGEGKNLPTSWEKSKRIPRVERSKKPKPA